MPLGTLGRPLVTFWITHDANLYSGENQPYQRSVGINPLNALIFGCDILTDLIVKYLQSHGYHVTIVDPEQDILIDLERKYTLPTILIKDHIMQDYLQESNIRNVDMFLALSTDDHTNVMVSQIAKHLFDVNTVICRIENPTLHEIYSQLGLQVIGKSDINLYEETTNLIEV